MSGNTKVYRPTHMPFFVSDGNGGLRMDSAGSQAVYNLEMLLLQQAEIDARVTEDKQQIERQETVDKYLDAIKRKGGKIPRTYQAASGRTYVLPRLASPQRIITSFSFVARNKTDRQLRIDRDKQVSKFAGTFVGYALEKGMYGTIDRVLAKCDDREEAMTLLKNEKQHRLFKVMDKKLTRIKEVKADQKWLHAPLSRRIDNILERADRVINRDLVRTKEENNWIYTPFFKHVEKLNDALRNRRQPLRFRFRKTWVTKTTYDVDLWAIYPNDPRAAEEGVEDWLGWDEVVDPRKY